MKKAAIALGFFDGLHLGHAALIKKTCERAAELSALATVLTFDTHPGKYVTGEAVELLTECDERAEIIRRVFGVENVFFIHFNESVMRMHWRDFLDSLCIELDATHLVVGHDFRFGFKGEGNVALLAQYCGEKGLTYDIISAVKMGDAPISSTRIRQHIKNGEIEAANALLGHPHQLSGTVRYGYKLGRRIGSPTINMYIPENVIAPRFGVYATRVFFGEEEHIAVTNIGVRPTVNNGSETSVESYILDYSGNLYGRYVRVEFYKFLRPEQQFDSIELLKEQIAIDEQNTRKFFEEK